MSETGITAGRVPGYDLARGLAVLLMLFINFSVFFPAGTDGGWIAAAADLMDRRAAVALVMISGAGLTLAGRCRSGGDNKQLRKILIHRSLFLVTAGYLLSSVWSGDILHFYGVFIFIGIFFLDRPDRTLIAALLLVLGLNLAQHLDGVAVFLEEHDSPLFNPVKDLLYSGYFPVFPWMSFFLAGMWVGRQQRIAIKGLVLISVGLMAAGAAGAWAGPGSGHVAGLLPGISDSLPFSVVSGLGWGMAVIMAGMLISDLPASWVPVLLTLLGKTSLSLYVFHIGFIIALEPMRLGPASAAAIFFVLYIPFIRYWLKQNPKGPLESFMRKFDPVEAARPFPESPGQ